MHAALLLFLAVPHGGTYPAPPADAPAGRQPAPPAAPDPGAVPLAPATPPSTGPTSPDGGINVGSWSAWWEFQREALLPLPDHGLASEGPARSRSRLPITAAMIDERIVPTLLGVLAAAESNDLVTAALIGLARVGDDLDEDARRALGDAIEPFLDTAQQEIQETAALALGILGDESAAPLLVDLLSDSISGREAVADSEVSPRTRAFSAYALGLIGHASRREDVRRFCVHALDRALAEDRTATPDLGVACVLALARVGLAWSGTIPDDEELARTPATTSREAQILHLLPLLGQRSLDEAVRAHVPTALALLVAEEDGALEARVVEELLDTFGSRRSELMTRLSCVVAFGILGDGDDDELDRRIRRALRDSEGDTLLYRFALISLARVAARPGNGSEPRDGDVRRELLKSVGRARSEEARWTALALALLERERPGADDAVTRALRLRLEDARTAADVGAFAIACGLTGELDLAEALLDKLRKNDDDAARGYAALALGLVGATGTTAELRRVLDEATYRPALLRDAALALSLLGDGEVSGVLSDKLVASGSLAAQAGLARALGRIGQSDDVEPLIELIEESRKSARARSFAVVALGLLADVDERPWSVVFSTDTNYPAAPGRTPTLLDAEGFGLLNIL